MVSPRASTDTGRRGLSNLRCVRLDLAEIDRLIDDMRHSTLSREENLDLFRDTFERREDAELCIGCAVAVVDAAGR